MNAVKAVKLSICIPTYNRPQHLINCLQSIVDNKHAIKGDFEVCISDNGSPDNGQTAEIVRRMESKLPIKYSRNDENIGIPRNFLKVVEMAEGDFAWLLGDDDLLFPHTIETVCKIIAAHPGVDFFFVNSCHLSTEFVHSFPQPFDTKNLPSYMEPVSKRAQNGELKFLELIDPEVSFDFLGGMFLAVFRRKKWLDHTSALSEEHIFDMRTFSHFDNTFPHVKIFSQAFTSSKAYFHAAPLSVCLSGAREWAPKYPFVRSVRFIESLEEYRKNGLPSVQYLKCRNFGLRYFIPDMIFMFIHRGISGYQYANPIKLILRNCIYPNFYLSFFNYFIRKLRQKINEKRA